MLTMSAAARLASRVLPDYAGAGITNLMSTIACAFDVPHAACPPLAAQYTDVLCAHRHVVLLLVDGLGLHLLQRHRPGGALASHVRATLTSVFPSTTATAITTLLTGLPPAAHALTGWHVWLEEIGAIGAVLPGHVRASEEPLAVRARGNRLFEGVVPLADRLEVDTHVVAPRRIIDSPYNLAHTGRAQRHGYTTLAQFFHCIERCTRSRTLRTYTYAYWPEFDSIAHEHGVDSAQAGDSLRRFDQGFERLLSALRGTDVTLVVTGDHGLLDAPSDEAIELEHHPRVAQLLERPLCGERRAAYCYVEKSRRAEFEARVQEDLGERVELHASGSLMAAGLFGPGPAHPRLASRIGDYVLIPRGRATIKDWLPGEKRYRQIGVHGGLSPDEMLVPLVIAEA
jgi:hypothetical protein